MADGRLFTDYRPNCEMNRYIESGNKIKIHMITDYFYQEMPKDLWIKIRNMFI